jgi:hypothetical protein
MTKQQPRPPHPCPCGCGNQIPHHLLACQAGWYLLPQPLRHRITGGGAGRLTAVSEALTWYREHVRDGAPLPASTRDGDDRG